MKISKLLTPPAKNPDSISPRTVVRGGQKKAKDITPDDVVIMISNSGETRELADMIAHCARFAIPMIAMTRRADSTLARSATHVLLMPDAPEACAIGMAPTTSTTSLACSEII